MTYCGLDPTRTRSTVQFTLPWVADVARGRRDRLMRAKMEEASYIHTCAGDTNRDQICGSQFT
jgi:hypothetical protein